MACSLRACWAFLSALSWLLAALLFIPHRAPSTATELNPARDVTNATMVRTGRARWCLLYVSNMMAATTCARVTSVNRCKTRSRRLRSWKSASSWSDQTIIPLPASSKDPQLPPAWRPGASDAGTRRRPRLSTPANPRLPKRCGSTIRDAVLACLGEPVARAWRMAVPELARGERGVTGQVIGEIAGCERFWDPGRALAPLRAVMTWWIRRNGMSWTQDLAA